MCSSPNKDHRAHDTSDLTARLDYFPYLCDECTVMWDDYLAHMFSVCAVSVIMRQLCMITSQPPPPELLSVKIHVDTAKWTNENC